MQQMLPLHAVPRTLADDLLVYTTGSRALHLFRRALLATMHHLFDLGGRLAPKISKLFTTVHDYKSWLAAELWAPIAAQIQAVAHLRDLGSAISVSPARATSNSYGRLMSGITTVAFIRRPPHDKERKGQLIMRSGHKKSFYGCESSQVGISMLAKYASEVLRTVGASSQQRSPSLTFGFVGLPFNIDPYIEVFQRRITILRRYLVKHPRKQVLVDRNYSAYVKMQYTCVHDPSLDLSSLCPAPLPGDAGRDD